MTILEKANQILNDKETNLSPENLKAGVTCLGVVGTLDANNNLIVQTDQTEVETRQIGDATAWTMTVDCKVGDFIVGNYKPENGEDVGKEGTIIYKIVSIVDLEGTTSATMQVECIHAIQITTNVEQTEQEGV